MKKLSKADILIMFGYSAGTKLYNLLYSSCANFCCIVKNCLGISSGGNAGLVLNQQGDWVNTQQFIEVANYAALPVTGEASKIYVTLDTNKLYRWTGSVYVEISPMEIPTLASVLDVGNASGANDISFDTTQGLYFANSSRLREGTIDAGLGGNKGVAQICALGYELKWEAGRLYAMEQDGFTIRWVLFQFNVTPTATDDNTKGYVVGSRWTLDSGENYVCTNASTGAAVWTLETVSSLLGFTPVTDARTITINGSAQNLTADRTFTVTDANLSTSDITTNDVSTTKHGFAPKCTSNLNGASLEISGTGAAWVGIVYTVELIAALTVDFYAPYNMKINSVTNITNSPTTTLQVGGVAYVLGNSISAGAKITVTVNTIGVVNLNITKV